MRRGAGPSARALVTAGIAAASAALAGCGDGAADPPPGLRATVEQSRDNENRGLLQLVLHNDGDDVVHVRRVQLRSPAYRVVPGRAFDEPVRPGSRRAFPVEQGTAVCDVGGPAGTVVVAGVRAGASVREIRLPVPDDDPLLPRLHARACALERVERAVDVAFATGWVQDGDRVTGELVLERRVGQDAVEVTDVQSSILFRLRPQAPLPLRLERGDRRAGLPVEVRPVRCDPHALLESKRSHTFPVLVSVAPPTGQPTRVQLLVTADEGGRALLDAVLREHCARQGIDLD